MKYSIRGVLRLALACAVAACSWVVSAVSHVAETVYVTCRAIKNLLADGFILMATDKPSEPEAVSFARAKSFVLRIARRERPVVTSSWRHCPSI